MNKKWIDVLTIFAVAVCVTFPVSFAINNSFDDTLSSVTQDEINLLIEESEDINFSSMVNKNYKNNYSLLIFWDETVKERWYGSEEGEFLEYSIPCLLRHHSNNTEKDWMVMLSIRCDSLEFELSSPSQRVETHGDGWSDAYYRNIEH